MLLAYLKEIKHPRAHAIADPNLKPNRLEMPWRTLRNKVDCGVFAMRHMETYLAQPLAYQKPGLFKESTQQDKTLDKLRKKYLCRLLNSEINHLSTHVMNAVKNYQLRPAQVRIQHAYEAECNIDERLAS